MIARLVRWIRLRRYHRCDCCGRPHAKEYLVGPMVVCVDCAAAPALIGLTSWIRQVTGDPSLYVALEVEDLLRKR